MSDRTFHTADTNILTERLQRAEKSIAFLQHEHTSTLADLHKEVTKWQQRYSDLTSQSAFGNIDDNKLRISIEQLENELLQSRNKIKSLNNVLEEKETIFNDYKTRLTVNDQKHVVELHKQHGKQREIRLELEQRSTSIAQLTNRLVREKQNQPNGGDRLCLGHVILPNKPRRMKNIDEQRQRHVSSTSYSSNRSSSLNNRTGSDPELANVLFIGRRPPQLQSLAPNTIESSDEQLFTKRQRQLLHNHNRHIDSNKIVSSRSTTKFSTVLPPIINRKMPLKATLPCQGEA